MLWSDDAEDRLFELTVDADRLATINAAVAIIERRLSEDPKSCEIIHEGLYGTEAIPLRVLFEILEDTDTVRIVLLRDIETG